MLNNVDSAKIQSYLERLVKPKGSLGLWEVLAERLCLTQNTLYPMVRPAELIVFAADHGVSQEGVTLWPSRITTLMIEQIAIGNSASGVLAQKYDVPYQIVDVGSAAAANIRHERLTVTRVAHGTRNFVVESAMSLHEFRDAMAIGAFHARETLERGARVVIAGDMGVGNSTSAACLARLLADVPLESCVGIGAGADENSLKRKREVVELATDHVLERCGRSIDDAGIAAVAGFEIAAIAGFYVQAARQRQTILLDGLVATAGALIAQWIEPLVVDQMIAAHLSDDPAHAGMLERLRLEPMLRWGMRLGEGTGALALFPLLEGAAAWLTQMSKFDEIGA